MGWTRARRYANHKGGRKYDKTTGELLPRTENAEKSKAAAIFYERYVAAEDDESRAAALRAHVAAVQARISELSRKDYATLHGAKTLDLTGTGSQALNVQIVV